MISEKLAELGITLPEAPKAIGSYVPCVRTGNLLYVAGQLPFVNGKVLTTGPVGVNCTPEEAKAAARQCVLNMLAVVSRELGTLDAVERVVQVQGFVYTLPGDPLHCVPTINGASDLLVEIFGEAGRHARAAICAPALPLQAAVEILFVLQVK
jgi:enamine deaminase RidA (YjgF/YER057c/UK114 family)